MKKVVISVISVLMISFIVFFFLGKVFTDNYGEEFEKKISDLSEDFNYEIDSSYIQTLPINIQKYFANNVKDIQTPVKLVNVVERSEIKTDDSSPFLQYDVVTFYSIKEPAYFLSGLLHNNKYIWTRSFESFINGEGNLLNKFISSVTISNAKGDQINQSFLTRYLIHAVMYPIIFITNKNIKWDQPDSNSVVASISFNNINSSVKYYFNKNNEIYRVTTYDKFRTTKIGYTNEQHTTLFNDYKWMGNFKIPTHAEHTWNLETNDFTYQRSKFSELKMK